MNEPIEGQAQSTRGWWWYFGVTVLFALIVLAAVLGLIRYVKHTTQARMTAISPAKENAYAGVAKVVAVEYHKPERGWFSSREGYWSVSLAAEGKAHTHAITEEVARQLKADTEVPAMLVPCGDPDLGLCEIILDPSGFFEMDPTPSGRVHLAVTTCRKPLGCRIAPLPRTAR